MKQRESWHWKNYFLAKVGACIGDSDQDHPHEKEMLKSKMAVWGGLTNSCEKKRDEEQIRKGKIYPFECRVSKNSKER